MNFIELRPVGQELPSWFIQARGFIEGKSPGKIVFRGELRKFYLPGFKLKPGKNPGEYVTNCPVTEINGAIWRWRNGGIRTFDPILVPMLIERHDAIADCRRLYGELRQVHGLNIKAIEGKVGYFDVEGDIPPHLRSWLRERQDVLYHLLLNDGEKVGNNAR